MVLSLLKTAVQKLPEKFNSECVFRVRDEGVDPADVVAWCELLADEASLDAAKADAWIAPVQVWEHLAKEASQVVHCGDIDDTAVALLSSFAKEARRRPGWCATDSGNPLGQVVEAVSLEWTRAVACDGELEDPEHEPAPIPDSAQRGLWRLFGELGLAPPPLAPKLDISCHE